MALDGCDMPEQSSLTLKDQLLGSAAAGSPQGEAEGSAGVAPPSGPTADAGHPSPADAVSPDKKQKRRKRKHGKQKRRPAACTGAPRGPPDDPDDLLTPAQLGGWLGFTESGLAKLRVRGGAGPKFIKIGSAVRYRRRDVLLYLDQQTAASTSDQPE
jgi:hypothetical protein